MGLGRHIQTYRRKERGMSKPKCDWCVWMLIGTKWERCATFHNMPFGFSAKRAARVYTERITATTIALPAGREPKGRP